MFVLGSVPPTLKTNMTMEFPIENGDFPIVMYYFNRKYI